MPVVPILLVFAFALVIFASYFASGLPKAKPVPQRRPRFGGRGGDRRIS
ncbi:MAG: hypothetical protein ACLP8B_01395 [Xanthobacteraceae bacterium]